METENIQNTNEERTQLVVDRESGSVTTLGAFAGLERIVNHRTNAASIGFGAEMKKKIEDPKVQGRCFDNVIPKDLVEFGMIPEFIGRLPVIATLEELDEDMLIKIMQEPKNALLKQYTSLFNRK